jgi:L-alanine-DL-glutamate epimerase-like enolase superfamily enzyme
MNMENSFMRGPQFILVDGNPSDGYSFVGPFDEDGANTYKNEHHGFGWVIRLQNPAEDDEERVQSIASLLAITEGYDPNKSTPERWQEFKEEFEERARILLDADPWRSDEEAIRLIRAIKDTD